MCRAFVTGERVPGKRANRSGERHILDARMPPVVSVELRYRVEEPGRRCLIDLAQRAAEAREVAEQPQRRRRLPDSLFGRPLRQVGEVLAAAFGEGGGRGMLTRTPSHRGCHAISRWRFDTFMRVRNRRMAGAKDGERRCFDRLRRDQGSQLGQCLLGLLASLGPVVHCWRPGVILADRGSKVGSKVADRVGSAGPHLDPVAAKVIIEPPELPPLDRLDFVPCGRAVLAEPREPGLQLVNDRSAEAAGFRLVVRSERLDDLSGFSAVRRFWQQRPHVGGDQDLHIPAAASTVYQIAVVGSGRPGHGRQNVVGRTARILPLSR
jgi:hypothetical protein